MEQDAARRTVLQERAVAIRDARSRATEEIRAAKENISTELAAARADLEVASHSLAAEIARAILERRPPAPRPMSEAR